MKPLANGRSLPYPRGPAGRPSAKLAFKQTDDGKGNRRFAFNYAHFPGYLNPIGSNTTMLRAQKEVHKNPA